MSTSAKRRPDLRALFSPFGSAPAGPLQGTTAGARAGAEGPAGAEARAGSGEAADRGAAGSGGVRRWVLWAALASALLALLAAAGVYESLGEDDDLAAYDRPVLDFFATHRLAWLTPIVAAFTRVGSAPVLSVVLLALVGWLCWRRRTLYPLLVLGGAAVASVVLTVVLKTALDRSRPPYELAVPPFETSGSFPSGHTLNSTALVLVLCYLLVRLTRPRWLHAVAVVVGLAYILAMGVSRLYLGAHWLTDVVSGWALGAMLAALAVVVDRLLLRRTPARVLAPGRRGLLAGPGNLT